LQIGERAQYIGKRTIPPLPQRLNGDDVFYRAAGIKQVYSVQLPLGARGYHNLSFGDVLMLYEVLLDHFYRDLLPLVLGLEEDDGVDVILIAFQGQLYQAVALANAGGDSLFPPCVPALATCKYRPFPSNSL